MGFDLKKRPSDKEKTVEIEGQTLCFKYNSKGYTPALLSRLESVATPDGGEPSVAASVDATIAILCAVLTSWDVESDGVPVLITADALQDVPFDVLNAVLAKINEAQTPNPTNSPTSKETSSTTEQ